MDVADNSSKNQETSIDVGPNFKFSTVSPEVAAARCDPNDAEQFSKVATALLNNVR